MTPCVVLIERMNEELMYECLIKHGLQLGNPVNLTEINKNRQAEKNCLTNNNITNNQVKNRDTRKKDIVQWKKFILKENSKKVKEDFFFCSKNKLFFNKIKPNFEKINGKVSSTVMIPKNEVKYWKRNRSYFQSKQSIARKESSHTRRIDVIEPYKNARKKKILRKSSKLHQIMQKSWQDYKIMKHMKSSKLIFKNKNLATLHKTLNDFNYINTNNNNCYYKSNMLGFKKEKLETFSKNEVILPESSCDNFNNTVSVQSARLEYKNNENENSEDDLETVIFDESEFISRKNSLKDIESHLKEISKKNTIKCISDMAVRKWDIPSVAKIKKKKKPSRAISRKKVSKKINRISATSLETSVEESMPELEDILSEVCLLVKHLHEAHRIIVQLIQDMSKNTGLADHFKTVIKTQQENFRKDIWKNQGTIMKGYDKMVNHCKNSSHVALTIGKRTGLSVEEVHNVISRCIFVESTCERQIKDIEKTAQPENTPIALNSIDENKDCAAKSDISKTFINNQRSHLNISFDAVASSSACNEISESFYQKESVRQIGNCSATKPLLSYTVPFHKTHNQSLVSTEKKEEEILQTRVAESNIKNFSGRDSTQKTSPDLQQERFSKPPEYSRGLQVQSRYSPNLKLPPNISRDIGFQIFDSAVCAPKKHSEGPNRHSTDSFQPFSSLMASRCTQNMHGPSSKVIQPDQSLSGHFYSNNQPPFPNQCSEFIFKAADFPSLSHRLYMNQSSVEGDSTQRIPVTKTLKESAYLKNILLSEKHTLCRPTNIDETSHSQSQTLLNCFPDRVSMPNVNSFVFSSKTQGNSVSVEPHFILNHKTGLAVSPDPTVPQKLTMKNHRLEAGAVLESETTKDKSDSDNDEPEVLKEVFRTKEIKKSCIADKVDLEMQTQRSRSYVCARSNCKKPGVQICDGCRSVIYCSDFCQLIHWTNKHLKECHKLKELRG